MATVSSDFRVKNGLIVGANSLGNVAAGNGTFNTSLTALALSGVDGGFSGTGAIRVPVGTTAQRPTVEAGLLRLNTTLSQFEGYSNSTWTGLGGVIDVDQDTKILAELSPTSDEDSLFFYTSGVERARITNTGTLSTSSDAIIAGDFTVQGNDIKSSGGTAITLSTTDVTIAGDLTIGGNDIKASNGATALTLVNTTGDVQVAGDIKIGGNSILDSGSNAALQLDGSGNVEVCGNLTVQGTHTTLSTTVTSTTTATENNFVITSTDDGATASPDLKLWRNSSTPADNDTIGNVIFTGNDSGGVSTDYGHILTQITDVTNATEDSRMTFKTMAAGTLADRLTINSGKVGIGVTTPSEALSIVGNLSASGTVCGTTVCAGTSFLSPLLSATNVCGGTKVCSPTVHGTTLVCGATVCGSTSVLSPLVCGTTKVCSPTVHGTTLVCGAAVCGSTSVCSPLVCGGTSVESPLVLGAITCGSTCVYSPIVCASNCVKIGSDTKFYRNASDVIRTPNSVIVDGALGINTTDITSADVTIAGTLSASGIIYADAFNSRTGGSTIDFNDDIDLAGTLTLTDDIVHSGDTDTKLSFTTDLITLYAANSNLLRIDGTNVVGIGTVTTASPSIPTVVEFNNDTTAYKSASATITNGASAALLTIPTASYRSGKVVIQSVAASGGHMDVTELLYIHNGTTVYTTEYGTIHVGSAIGTYTGVINGSNVEIRAANGVGVTAEFVGSITMLSV